MDKFEKVNLNNLKEKILSEQYTDDEIELFYATLFDDCIDELNFDNNNNE